MKRFLKLLRSYLPSKLPVGITAFHKYADDIIEIGGQYASTDSMKFAIASQIIHMDAYTSSVPMQRIIRCLRKSAANQVASQVFQDIKNKMAEEQAKLKQAEETAAQEKLTSEPVQ